MRNNFFLIFFLLVSFDGLALANEFKFTTSQIKILDEGNYIEATNGKAVSEDDQIEIIAKKFEYKKNLKLLKAIDGLAIFKPDNIEIKFEEIQIDQKNSIVSTKKSTTIKDIKRNLSVETSFVNYDKKNKILESNSKSLIKDKFDNSLSAEKFYYDINNDILKIENSILKDSKKNTFKIELAFINTKSNKLFGKDVEINLNNESFNQENEPRLKGRALIYENDYTEVTKGVFTTCKKRDNCPPWQLSAKKIKHDKKKEIINYNDAMLKIYDIPVFYFPRFFHPDPSVKRKSGFLIPALRSSTNNTDNYLSIPYFHVISENKDLTLSPRLYSSSKILVQSEYRQVNVDNNSIADFSFFKEKNNNTKSHLFYDFNKNLNLDYFDDSNIKLKIQRTSNDTYLRAHNIESEINTSTNTLENFINLELYSDDLSIDANITAYENLDRISSDRYEFIPQFNLSKKLENKTKLNGDFVFNTKNLFKNYDTNVFETININDLTFSSYPKITKNGFYNNYEFILKNANSDAQNSTNYKNHESNYLSGLLQLNSSLPLIKENNDYQNILNPKIALKISPDFTKNKKNSFTRLDVNNIYGLNRLASGESLEGGMSLTFGNEFKRINKKDLRENIVLKLANNIRLKDNVDLPTTNQMGFKTSNLFGEISYDPNEFFTTKYNFSKKNNFDDITYESIVTTFNMGDFVTSFDYINENDTQEKTSYLLSKLAFNINSSSSISFSTRENKKKDLTEYYNFMYQYKNDCLAASVEYNKNYYDDRDIKPEESIFFKLTIMPFGQIASTPDLMK